MPQTPFLHWKACYKCTNERIRQSTSDNAKAEVKAETKAEAKAKETFSCEPELPFAALEPESTVLLDPFVPCLTEAGLAEESLDAEPELAALLAGEIPVP